MSYRWNRKQKIAYHSTRKNLFTLFGGAKGGGKSIGGVRIFQSDISNHSNGLFVVCRSNYTTLQDTTKRTFERFFPADLIERDGAGRLKKTETLWKCVNGNEILFWAADVTKDPDYEKTRGLEASAFMVDEASQFPELFYEILPSLLRNPIQHRFDGSTLNPYAYLTSNPVIGKHWLRTNFIEPKTRKEHDHLFIQSLPDENELLPAGYLDRAFSTMGSIQRDMLRYGRWFDQIGEFIRAEYFGRFELKPKKVWNFYIDSAFGTKTSDSTAILSGNYEGQWFDVRDIRTVNLTTLALVEYLKDSLPMMGYTDQSTIVIENAANGRPLYELLNEQTSLNVRLDDRSNLEDSQLVTGEVNAKAKRLLPQMARIESGRVRLLEGGNWLQSFLDECVMFDPKKKEQEDDQLDVLEMFMRNAVSDFGSGVSLQESLNSNNSSLYSQQVNSIFE